MPVLSHSKIKTFQQCGWKYRLEYLDKVPQVEESIETFRGHRVHEALERLYRTLRDERRVLSADDVVAGYQAAWAEQWHDGVFLARSMMSAVDCRAQGEVLLRDYMAAHPLSVEDDATVAVEEEMVFPLDESGAVEIRCVIDRLARRADGTWEIHDYKTGAYLPDDQEIDRDPQLAIYQLAIQHAHPEAVDVDLVWHFLAHRREVRRRRTPEQQAELRRWLLERVQEIERTVAAPETLQPAESALCAWCAYATLCPVKKHVIRVRRLPDAERLADFGVRLVNGYAAGVLAGYGRTHEEARYRARLVNYARHENVSVLEGSSWQARIEGENVTLRSPEYADRRC